MLSERVNYRSITHGLPSTSDLLGEVMAARVRVRVDELDQIATIQGLRSRYALAKRLHVSLSTVSRVLDGDQAPGEQFIAATIHALDVPFEAVFEVVEGVADEVPGSIPSAQGGPLNPGPPERSTKAVTAERATPEPTAPPVDPGEV
jgi:transcriptional regulator with XRE-family HTH domain